MKPVLVYDGDCGFCRYWVARWAARTDEAVAYRSFQEAAGDFRDVSAEEFRDAVHFIDGEGRVFRGAEAVFRCLAHAPGRRWLAWAYENVPGFAMASESAYRFVASHRDLSAFVTRLLWGLHYEPSRFYLARSLFLRNLGLIFFVAFLSFYQQIDGLIGENGILPAAELNEYGVDRLGTERYWQLPTLYWLHPADGFLHVLCIGGMAASLLVAARVLVPIGLVVAWAAYLSLINVSRDFLSFQWDILLLETAFLAMFLAPMQLVPRFSRERRPVPFVLLLHWWLLFRLMFASGYVKLADPTWTQLEALSVHYETQPLPNTIAWYVHQLPDAFHAVSVVLMFAIELAVPFCMLFPRRIRHAGGAILIAFQLLIVLTGNYTFFNWLAIALCLLLFDDQALRATFKRLARLPGTPESAQRPVSGFKWITGGVIGLAMLVLSVTVFTMQLTRGRGVPELAMELRSAVQPFHLVNNYGLFAHMTTSRPEIIVEGSNDGVEWAPYRFKWKPGDLDKRPRQVAPFQPRLDWQMWFAALGGPRSTPWFGSFVLRLLQGSPEVLDLLTENPFPDAPPRYIRARLFDYRFTTLVEKRETGRWWRREYLGDYLPPVSLPRDRGTVTR